MASSEVVPFAKTGGLGDVCGALPRQLSKLGHNTILFLPAFPTAFQAGVEIEPTGFELSIPIGNKVMPGRILQTKLPDSDVTLFLIEQDEYFARDGFYGENGEDYPDNCERFIFFCRSVVESINIMKLDIDLIHCNDWQTGLIPAFLDIEYRKIPRFRKIATLMTIHNLAYQGWFPHSNMTLTGLDWKYFNWQQMEFYNQLNLLKTGIAFANRISTVSETYAQEIQTPEFGCGLDGVLRDMNNRLSGIVNGVDYQDWNPTIDQHLVKNYSVQNWREGKAACKQDLQKTLNLPQRADVPVIGLVGRLAEQKGWDLVTQIIQSSVNDKDIQWVILGTGEQKYHDDLQNLAKAHGDKVGLQLRFCNKLAHQIEAGSDMFLMPSRYEPCGLNQMYSLIYGSVPIVHATGGLVDTITDTNPESLAEQTANGFRFEQFDVTHLQAAVDRALDVFQNQLGTWANIVETGMKQDWSWSNSAKKYVELYQRTIAARSKELQTS